MRPGPFRRGRGGEGRRQWAKQARAGQEEEEEEEEEKEKEEEEKRRRRLVAGQLLSLC